MGAERAATRAGRRSTAPSATRLAALRRDDAGYRASDRRRAVVLDARSRGPLPVRARRGGGYRSAARSGGLRRLTLRATSMRANGPQRGSVEHGIAFEQSCASRKVDIYVDLLPLLNARRLSFSSSASVVAARGLERRTARSRAETRSIMCPAATTTLRTLSRACWSAWTSIVGRRWSSSAMCWTTVGRRRCRTCCHLIFAVIVAVEANVAVVFTGSRHRMPPLWVLDVEAEPYYGGFFRDVARRLGELERRNAV